MTGLLDEYPGAAAAYSLRLLNTDYTGDAVIVRRASDNATQSIGFVDGELDTDTLDTFCSGTDGFVTTWFDQSGNGVNAVQTTASSQPKIFDSTTGVILDNGKPAIYINETYLENLTKPASASSTAYIVHKGDTGVTSNVSVFGFPANSYFAHIGLYYWGTDVNKPLGFNSWSADSFGYSNAEADFASHSIWTGLFKQGNIATNGVRLFKDGVEKSLSQVLGVSTNRTFDDGIYIGRGGTIVGNQEGNGYYQEIVIYDNELVNQSGIEDNINNYYSIY